MIMVMIMIIYPCYFLHFLIVINSYKFFNKEKTAQKVEEKNLPKVI